MAAAGLLYFGVFALTGLWFWAVLVAWLAVTFVDVHNERPGWATIWLFAFLAALHLGGVVDVIHLVWTRPWLILGVFGAYLCVGLIWTVFKFKLWLRKLRIRINEQILPSVRENFLLHHQVSGTVIPQHLQEAWRKEQGTNHAMQHAIKSMEVKENKGRLTLWAIWWPISMIWTAISDWVTEIFNYLIFEVLGKFLRGMVDSEKAKISYD